jgi:MFS family permease
MTQSPTVAETHVQTQQVNAQPVPEMSWRQIIPYMSLAGLIALSQGLGQGFVSTNLPQLAGDLGVSVTDATWLVAAYMAPRASLPLLLGKLRTQYGLLKFARIAMVFYVVVSFAACFALDFHSALTLQFIAGCAAAPMSTLAFLYMLEPLPQRLKLVFGLPMAMAVIMGAPNLARVISPALIGDGGFLKVHLLTLGLACISLALALRLPLKPQPTAKVVEFADIRTFALIASSFGGIAVCAVVGPIYWWTEVPWIGVLLVASIICLVLAVMSELYRKAPLIDFRWLASPAMLQMTAAMFVFRLLLSEQSSGAPRMFQVLGFGSDALMGLFAVIVIAGLLVPLACLAYFRPGREPWFHSIALLLIAIGAWMDSQSTVLTRPADMVMSQMLIAFAGMLFMAPAMVMGLLAALKRGPSYLMSFIVVFLSTQSLGGVIGSGLFTTIINHRQAFHLQTLTEQLRPDLVSMQNQISQTVTQLATQSSDLVANRMQATSSLIQEATRQATVMAYNDAYLLTAIVAIGALFVLVLHLIFDQLVIKFNSLISDVSVKESGH